MTTAQELQDKRDVIQKESETFVSQLESDLKKAKDERFTAEYQSRLTNEIKSSKKTYGDILAKLDQDISDARAQETREAAQKQKAVQLSAAEEKQKIHDQLKAVWIDQKGDPDVFEKQFPTLYAAEMQKRTLQNSLDQDPGERRARDLITRAF